MLELGVRPDKPGRGAEWDRPRRACPAGAEVRLGLNFASGRASRAGAREEIDPGGFDYTGADGQAWMREAGFTSTRVEHLVGPDSMIVGIK